MVSKDNKGIHALNRSAQLEYRGAGNPPSSHPSSAISNAYPGLEMDIRNIWKRIFVGIELHESSTLVVGVDADTPEMRTLTDGFRLIKVGESSTMVSVVGPKYVGDVTNSPLPDTTLGDIKVSLEWSNALAAELAKHTGSSVRCVFESIDDPPRTVELTLQMRSFFEPTVVEGVATTTTAVTRELAPPGALTQSLCSPWQNDYRECACFYWAATRPDYVNVQPRPDGSSAGHNWMHRNRDFATPPHYINDDWQDPSLVSYAELFQTWETVLRFVFGGLDEPPLQLGDDK